MDDPSPPGTLPRLSLRLTDGAKSQPRTRRLLPLSPPLPRPPLDDTHVARVVLAQPRPSSKANRRALDSMRAEGNPTEPRVIGLAPRPPRT